MKSVIMLIETLLCLTLYGCSAAAFWLSGRGNPNADLVVVNDSGRAVYSIVLEYENSTETVQAARGGALMEPGQTFGLALEEGEVLVTLRDRAQRIISQNRVNCQEGRRLFLTVDGVTEGGLSVEEEEQAQIEWYVEEIDRSSAAEDQEAVFDLDFFYQNPVTQAYQDIRTLGKSYDVWQAQTDMCFIINAMVHNDILYYEFMERYQNQEDTFIRVVQGTDRSGICIDDILYDSSTDKIYLVHDSTRDNTETDKGITLNEFEGIAEYRYDGNGRLYWIAFNGAIDDIDFDGDEIFIITLIN